MASDAQSSATLDKAKGVEEMTLQLKYEQLQERYVKLLEDKIEELSGKTDTKTAPSRRDSTVTFAGNEAASSTVKTGKTVDGNDSTAKIQYRMDTYDEKGMPIQEPYDPAQFDKNLLKSEGSTAATFVYYFNRQKIQILTELKIESHEVKVILQKHLKHYPGYHWEIPQLSIFSPFEPLIHNWKALNEAVSANPEDKGHQDLAAILEAVKVSKDVKEYFQSDYNVERDVMEVLFKYLWTIFPPGELVIMSTGFMKKHPQLFIVRDTQIVRTRDRKEVANLTCWSYDWDGTRKTFSRACVDIKIDFFKGQRRITTLPCYPLRLYENGDNGALEKLRLKLVRRGMLFHDLCTRPRGNQLFDYDGTAFLRGTGVRHIDPTASTSNIDSDDESVGHTLARSRSSMHSVPTKMVSKSGRQMNIKGRVMVDFESYARHGPDEPIPMGDLKLWPFDGDEECGCEKCKEPGGPYENQRSRWDANEVIYTGKLPKRDITDDECRQFMATKLTEDEIQRFMLCAPRVLGYHLMEKKWIEMFVDDVKDVDHRSSKEAFDKVQLPANQKVLIRELVQSHSNDKDVNKNTPRSKMNDLTKGKGEGLVILLHGPPGVGKTLTAESVAQVTKKPLFPMGVGDVTTDPVKVESRLEQLFELAEVWHAVMLFDEADVFLESRASSADVTRVGLVSVLLRILEYYQGILILTTNRIKSFDIAVQSRINLAVKFEDLKHKQLQAIFKNLLDQLDDEFIDDKRDILEWFEDDEAYQWSTPLNGRQIRNVVFSAASLAGSKKENKLTLKEIKTMFEETYKFHTHLESVTMAAREKNEMYINRKAA
ncbi:hypothetical protein G7054_g9217 [Neopestalotiopsis clavispora]|nr:hypothetical protein G7054_g9217 [Neopestalotiopsis clavispora]